MRTSTDKLRVLLVDDHNLFRKGLASLLSMRRELEVVGEAEGGRAAIEMACQLAPDLVLMDVHMPECNGIEATQTIKREMPRTKIVMLSASDDDDDLFRAIKNGADGYLLKNVDPTQLFVFLAGIRHGESPISGVLAERILQEFRRADLTLAHSTSAQDALTRREIETLELLVKGESNKEIASALHISENTVKLHLRDIMEKLHLQNRIQVAVYAVRQGLVESSASP